VSFKAVLLAVGDHRSAVTRMFFLVLGDRYMQVPQIMDHKNFQRLRRGGEGGDAERYVTFVQAFTSASKRQVDISLAICTCCSLSRASLEPPTR
jgi:hypothetical protein